MGEVLQLSPHVNMTVEDCLTYCNRNAADYQDVIVIGYDQDGDLIIRSSHLSRADASFLLMNALDQAKGQ